MVERPAPAARGPRGRARRPRVTTSTTRARRRPVTGRPGPTRSGRPASASGAVGARRDRGWARHGRPADLHRAPARGGGLAGHRHGPRRPHRSGPRRHRRPAPARRGGLPGRGPSTRAVHHRRSFEPGTAVGHPRGRAIAGLRHVAVGAGRAGCRPSATTGVGVLLTEMPGTTNLALIEKQVGPDTTLETVTVGQDVGYWIAGGQHELPIPGPRRPEATGHHPPRGQHAAVGGGRRHLPPRVASWIATPPSTWPATSRPCPEAYPQLLLADDVEGAAGLEPLDLLVAEGVVALEVDGGAVGLVDGAPHRRCPAPGRPGRGR